MGVGGTGDADLLTRESITTWARDLIDLSQRNHALYHRPTKRSSLDLRAPDPLTLHRLLSDGDALPFLLPPVVEDAGKTTPQWSIERSLELAGPKHVVTDRVDGQDLQRTLTNLMRTTNQDWLDRAVRTLYVAFGQLIWAEDLDGKEMVRSPLIYLPVMLRRGGAKDPFLLEPTDEEAILNPSLVMKLNDAFGLDLLELAEDVSTMSTMDEVLEQVEEAVDELGWRVEHAAALKRATFHKESMYRDLMQNLPTIAEHTIVRSMAGVPSARTEAPDSGIPSSDELDTRAPLDKAHLVLDADESQRRAVFAAAAGVSFVMDGPPGTGKSQTIVNTIAELIATGKSVLFVSEKAAALEVVAKRLADVGLSDFILELHSHKANRKEVVQELARSLKLQPRASGGMNKAERARLEKRRRELNDYAHAVNEERMPLARSVSWAAGRAAQLHDVPELAPPDSLSESLDLATLETILTDARVLAASWDRIRAGDFAWHGARNDTRPGPEAARRTLREVRTALEALREACTVAADALGLETPQSPSDIEHVRQWLTLLAARPPGVTAELLAITPPDRTALRATVESVGASARALESASAELAERFPGGWQDVDAPSTGDLDRVRKLLTTAVTGLGTTRRLTDDLLRDGLRIADELVADIAIVSAEAADIAERCGAGDGLLTREKASRVAGVAGRSSAPARPDPSWLKANNAFAVESVLTELQRRRETAKRTWRPVDSLLRHEAIDIDLRAAIQTLRGATGLFARFGSEARAARGVLRQALRRDPRDVDDAELDLVLKAWTARRALREAEERHAPLVGGFQHDGETDLGAARDALGLAMDVRRAGGDEFQPQIAERQFCGSGSEDPDLAPRGQRLSAKLEQFEAALASLEDLGVAIPRTVDFDALLARLEELRTALASAVEVLGPMLLYRSAAASVNDLAADLQLMEQATSAESELATHVAGLHERPEIELRGQASALDSLDMLRTAIDWTDRVEVLAAGPISAERAAGLAVLDEADAMAERIATREAELLRAIDNLRSFVGHVMAARIDPDLQGDFAVLRDRVALLERSADQLPDWWEHIEARSSLVDAGLEPLLEEALRTDVPPDLLPAAIERSLLTGWLEGVLQSDKRLASTSAATRDSRVDEFRRMDARLLSDSASRVIEACAARLPRGSFGGGNIILREAQKKARHLPVRSLFEKAGPIITRLKPCLMMSPLSVSQYVPADWRFDVVVFDEASQIPPQDAINCIYRSSQVIIAGDDKQLPPTSFFELAGNDDGETVDDTIPDEFESVLKLARTSEELAEFGLRWHYRSRHEDLITFSNHSFYEGDLVTYPGAVAAGPSLGVKHHLVEDGVYHRGKSRDNPREAERVAEIVAAHIRESPGLSIGVVALSSAQANAIEDAIDRLRREDSALDRAFRADRLDGFFVKNLENVQGDDRDIIVLSIGYGPDLTGKLTMNFGPMNQAGGWRRLNVAITRARNRMDVVSSFRAEQIRPGGGSSSIGVLKDFLAYAEGGRSALAAMTTGTTGEPESPFEEEVVRVLKDWGYDPVSQVGAASYRIDIGIRHPDDPDRYVLGIECDGAMYHSSRVARDRDRLRQQVLEGLGWTLHRIWGPAWFRSRRAAEEELRKAVELALTEVNATEPKSQEEQPSTSGIEIELVERDLSSRPDWARPFQRFDPPRLTSDPTTKKGRSALRRMLLDAIAVEAPIHRDRLVELARTALDRPRGRSLTELVTDLVHHIATEPHLRLDDAGFVHVSGADVEVRYPEQDADRREIDHIPGEEIAAAVRLLVMDAVSAEVDDVERAVRDLFGFRRLGGRISAAIATAIDDLETAGELRRDPSGRLTDTQT